MHAPLILHRGCEAVRVVSVLCWQWHGNYQRSSAGHAHYFRAIDRPCTSSPQDLFTAATLHFLDPIPKRTHI